MAQEDLKDLGLTCDFLPIDVGRLGDETWQGVARRYWKFETYYVPLASFDTGLDERSQRVTAPGDWRRWPRQPVRASDDIDSTHSGRRV